MKQPNFRLAESCVTCFHCQMVKAAKGHGEDAIIEWCVKYNDWPLGSYVCDGYESKLKKSIEVKHG